MMVVLEGVLLSYHTHFITITSSGVHRHFFYNQYYYCRGVCNLKEKNIPEDMAFPLHIP
jgi:hypothetical protein